jgi:hypothetical protein
MLESTGSARTIERLERRDDTKTKSDSDLAGSPLKARNAVQEDSKYTSHEGPLTTLFWSSPSGKKNAATAMMM